MSFILSVLQNSTLDSFTSFCGAEWMMGKKVVKTFMGLVFLNIAFVCIAITLVVIIVFLRSKLTNLQQTREAIDAEGNKTEVVQTPQLRSGLDN